MNGGDDHLRSGYDLGCPRVVLVWSWFHNRQELQVKTNDQQTWHKCDHCGKAEACRFFELSLDTGGQVAVWWTLPPSWMFSHRDDGECDIACSADCAIELSKTAETALIKFLERGRRT